MDRRRNVMEGVTPVRLITVTDTAGGATVAVTITVVSEAETRVYIGRINDIVQGMEGTYAYFKSYCPAVRCGMGG